MASCHTRSSRPPSITGASATRSATARLRASCIVSGGACASAVDEPIKARQYTTTGTSERRAAPSVQRGPERVMRTLAAGEYEHTRLEKSQADDKVGDRGKRAQSTEPLYRRPQPITNCPDSERGIPPAALLLAYMFPT